MLLLFRSLNRTLDLPVEGTHVDLRSSSSLQGIVCEHPLLLLRASVRKCSNKFNPVGFNLLSFGIKSKLFLLSLNRKFDISLAYS